MKNKKRLVFLVFALVCLCLLFVIPTFADSIELTQDDLLNVILVSTGQQNTNSAFEYMLTSDLSSYDPESFPYLYQFKTLQPYDYLGGVPFSVDFTSSENSYVIVKDLRNNTYRNVGLGSWSVTKSISQDVLTLNYVYFYRVGSTSVEAFRLVTTVDNLTYEVISSNFRSDRFGLYGTGDQFEIAFGSNRIDSVVMQFIYGYSLASFSVNLNYDTYISAYLQGYNAGSYEEGYSNGLTAGYNRGYEEGERAGYNTGIQTGEERGYNNGYEQGYNDGYEIGKQDGLDENGYQQGLADGRAEITDNEFGKNFLGNVFSAPFEGLQKLTLIEWTTEGGQVISISIMTVFYTMVGIALFIWFLKLFAGG